MIIKLGENFEISKIENTESCVYSVNDEVLESFRKQAMLLKQIAPKAEDFLYFSAVMMHAAEASSLNDDGTVKLTRTGAPVKVGWNKSNNTWKWETNDPSIKPYKNSNGDIFPEEELVRAHKKWNNKPLCIDHKSNSVDHLRGFIVDTYYDRNLKRVIALCALDKKNYPDLARKVATMYSTSVSMGTAVGRAICTDCGRVARTEADFCEHMKHKSSYGEINVDLNPIELSIVVNGADPKAHIKHIIAAANTLNSYVAEKEEQLNKLAKTTFNATLDVFNQDGTSESIKLTSDSLDELKKDISTALAQLNNIQNSINKNDEDTNDSAFNQSSGSVAMEETVQPGSDLSLSPPNNRYASSKEVIDLKNITASIQNKLEDMQNKLEKLANSTAKTKQEENMSGSKINKVSYFQGGGEGNEPTPGQPAYDKDPTNQNLRTDGDKHMEVDDIGPVDGLHPGPSSVGMSELERKKMLARAENRNAAVMLAKQALENKKAYFNAGDKNPQEPTPGKTKYAPDKLNEDLREDGDKQMNGQKPFPGVGAVDGLHPSPSSADIADEKKRKELLQRASYKAKFVKASNYDGTINLGKSAWEVFLGDRLLLTASVDQLSGKRAEFMYDSIATKEFGSKLIEKIKIQGADKVNSLIKSAQDPNAVPAPAPAPATETPAPEAVPAPEATNMGDAGNPADTAKELIKAVTDTNTQTATLISDLGEAVSALTGESNDIENAVSAPEGAALATSATLHSLRKELNSSITYAMKESISKLADHANELDMISEMYENGISPDGASLANSIVQDAVTEAKSAIADGFTLMNAFVKYARGTESIIKSAQIAQELEELSTDGDSNMTDSNNELASLISETDTDLADVDQFLNSGVDADVVSDDTDLQDMLNEMEADLSNTDDENDLTLKPGETVPTGIKDGTVEVKNASFDSLSGRNQMRAKLAAEALKTSPHFNEAHPKGGFTTQLDVKPTGDLAKIETIDEEHEAMLELAKAPPKVRKEAEEIHRLVKAGELDVNDLDSLVSMGLDKDAVAYYRKYFNQVDGGSEFVSALVKEHAQAKVQDQMDSYKIKLARAYELSYDMVSRGMCLGDSASIAAQADEIMNFNDESFNTLKRVVAQRSPIAKTAGHMPQVGLNSAGDSRTVSTHSLVDELGEALSKTTKGMF